MSNYRLSKSCVKKRQVQDKKKIVKTMSFNFRSSKEAKIILSNESKLKAEGKNTHNAISNHILAILV